jgi:hypothetical protein
MLSTAASPSWKPAFPCDPVDFSMIQGESGRS